MGETREHVHELIERLPPAKLPAIAGSFAGGRRSISSWTCSRVSPMARSSRTQAYPNCGTNYLNLCSHDPPGRRRGQARLARAAALGLAPAPLQLASNLSPAMMDADERHSSCRRHRKKKGRKSL